jgi:membrane protease YdiL (CAAX protease family)
VAAVGWAVLIYVGFWVAAAVYGLVVGQPPEQRLVTNLKKQDSLVVLGAFAILVGLIAPLVEEFFFRGFLFGVLREKLGVVWGVLVAGSVFGLIHAAGTPLRTLGILVVLGIGLCVLYAKTGSLLPGIALHSLHNSISFGVTKGLVWWGFILLVVSSVTLVLLVARVIIARERRYG